MLSPGLLEYFLAPTAAWFDMLLRSLLQHQGMALAQLLASPTAALPPAAGINGLLDCQGTPEEAAAEAAALLRQQPYAALKIKVGRRADPLADAAAVLAIRQEVGPEVVLRADANRRWALEQAVQVCVCAHELRACACCA